MLSGEVTTSNGYNC